MLKKAKTFKDLIQKDIDIVKIIDKKNRQVIIAQSSKEYIDNRLIQKNFFLDNGLSLRYFKNNEIEINFNHMLYQLFDTGTGNMYISYAFEAGYYKNDVPNKDKPYLLESKNNNICIKEENLLNFLNMSQNYQVNWNNKAFDLWLDLLASIRNHSSLDIILRKQKKCFEKENIKQIKKKVISFVSLKECLFLVALHHKNLSFIQHFIKFNQVGDLAQKYLRSNKEALYFYSQINSYEYLAILENLNLINCKKLFNELIILKKENEKANELCLQLYEKFKLEKSCNRVEPKKRYLKI